MKHPSAILFSVLMSVAMSSSLLLAQPGGSCANPLIIPSAPYQNLGNCDQADNCPGEPFRDIFYSFTAPVSAYYVADLCQSPSQLLSLRIWTGGTCCNGPSALVSGRCGPWPRDTVRILAGQTVYFECGTSSPEYLSQPFLFNLSAPLLTICAGAIQTPVSSLSFPPVVVGGTVTLTLPVVNADPNHCLDVTDIRTNGHVWQVSPTSFTVAPGQQQMVNVSFAPTFPHDFYGTIEIISSDFSTPVDSVALSGAACRPVVPPPIPVLRDANAPTAFYFQPPWVHANPDQEYAIEVSGNEGVRWVDWPGGLSDQPVFATAIQWGVSGECLIESLLPNSAYQVRFMSRSCAGVEQYGQFASWNTGNALVVATPDLTLQVIDPTIIYMNWDPVARDTSGNPVENFGWVVMAGDRPDSIETPIGFVQIGSASINPADYGLRKIFDVEPRPVNAWAGARPFVSWPPDGSTLAGRQDIVIKDAMHIALWDSFRIEADSMGTPVLLGSNRSATPIWSRDAAVNVNFSKLGSGPHAITATVVDDSNQSHISMISVNVVAEPHATFDATYDSVRREFSLVEQPDTLPPGFSFADALWLCSHVNERYGSNPVVPWSLEFDSLTIVKVIPQINEGLLWEPGYYFDEPGEHAGVTPETHETTKPANRIRCCCESLTLVYSDDAPTAGSYKQQKDTHTGPFATCKSESGAWSVGFGFEVTQKLKLSVGETEQHCMWGQDAKGTRVFWDGECKAGVAKAKTKGVKYKQVGNTDYPYSPDNDNFGNDSHGPKSNLGERSSKGWRDESGLPGDKKIKDGATDGTVRWFDPASDHGVLGNNESVRDSSVNRFFARSDPPCAEGTPCCKIWETRWDVTFCKTEDSCYVSQSVEPTLTPIDPPAAGCPALK